MDRLGNHCNRALSTIRGRRLGGTFKASRTVTVVSLVCPGLSRLRNGVATVGSGLGNNLTAAVGVTNSALANPGRSLAHFGRQLANLVVALNGTLTPTFRFITSGLNGILIFIAGLLRHFPVLARTVTDVAINFITLGSTVLVTGLTRVK